MTAASLLRVVVVDDERPARRFLAGLLKICDSVELVGEAGSGEEAIALINAEMPHLALIDLQMPEMTGLEVVRRLSPNVLPLVAFVTAFDDFAIEAFELNAVDYLLKPVEGDRLAATLTRARARLAGRESAEQRSAVLQSAAAAYERGTRRRYLDRIPVRKRDEVIILSVRQIASIVAEAEQLHITTIANERYTIVYRLHALEERLDARRFVRLGRGTLANIDMIAKLSPMPGGTYMATMSNGQELNVSRIQSRILRETLLKL
jgi:two-component system LytT family response regulator